MRRLNIASPEFVYDESDPEGFRSGMHRVGPLLGAVQLGATVYELPPGQSICPYHYEYAEEEWLLVLAGAPTLRHPEGSDRLEPWDLVLFPTGPEGAHGVTNETDEPVRVLMFSTVKHPGATVYPDSDKIGVWTGNKADDLIVHRESGVDYWSGETPRS
ncbi:MAG TPA: cupin domain-containing protein [Gaiellaceae bacterium]|nr:cupin domain-containing protein [Gaiellaceae bacterium]